jgi:hypothetical protein
MNFPVFSQLAGNFRVGTQCDQPPSPRPNPERGDGSGRACACQTGGLAVATATRGRYTHAPESTS